MVGAACAEAAKTASATRARATTRDRRRRVAARRGAGGSRASTEQIDNRSWRLDARRAQWSVFGQIVFRPVPKPNSPDGVSNAAAAASRPDVDRRERGGLRCDDQVKLVDQMLR